jgi:hypothetical protein
MLHFLAELQLRGFLGSSSSFNRSLLVLSRDSLSRRVVEAGDSNDIFLALTTFSEGFDTCEAIHASPADSQSNRVCIRVGIESTLSSSGLSIASLISVD